MSGAFGCSRYFSSKEIGPVAPRERDASEGRERDALRRVGELEASARVGIVGAAETARAIAKSRADVIAKIRDGWTFALGIPSEKTAALADKIEQYFKQETTTP